MITGYVVIKNHCQSPMCIANYMITKKMRSVLSCK